MSDIANVIAVSFDEQSKAFQAYSELKSADASGLVEVLSAALVQRDENGSLRMPEAADVAGGAGLAGGSLVGMLVGVLGGPVGMLLGWGTGALVGGAVDGQRADRGDELLMAVSQAIPPGGTALLAEVNEPAPAEVDKMMAGFGGVVVRRPAADILAEMEAAEDAAEAAEKEARKAQRERKKAEVHEKYEDRKAKLRAKFTHHHDASEKVSE